MKMDLETDPDVSEEIVKFLDDESASKLMNICLPEEFESEVANILGKRQTHLNLGDAALVDFYVAGLWWALRKGFNLEQFQAFSSLLHQQIINISEKRLSMVEHLEELKSTVERMEEFKEEKEMKEVVDYLMVSIYRPYKMYEFLFNEERCALRLDGNFVVQTIHGSIEPLPLNEGISKEDYDLIFLDKPKKKTCEKEEEKQLEAGEEEEEEEVKELLLDEMKAMAGIPKEKILEAVEEIFNELAPGIQEELVCKLEEKKNLFLNRINVTNSLRNFKF